MYYKSLEQDKNTKQMDLDCIFKSAKSRAQTGASYEILLRQFYLKLFQMWFHQND